MFPKITRGDVDRARAEAMIAELDRIGQGVGRMSAQEAERGLFDHVLSPLLEAEGYEVEYRHGPGDRGIDYLARKDLDGFGESLGIEFRHRSPNSMVNRRDVYATVGAGTDAGLDRMILLTNSRFSSAARDVRADRFPVALELFDWAALRSWASRAVSASEGAYHDVTRAVHALIKEKAGEFARLVAKDVRGLSALEWRDLERTLAEVFEGLGYETDLTPASKDGGKDIVVSFVASGATRSYVVEVKHWRSGKRVGEGKVRDFVKVIADERRSGGLYLSTYGYTDDAFESLTEVERSTIGFGGKAKVAALCKTYVKAGSGLWTPQPDLMEEFLYKETE